MTREHSLSPVGCRDGLEVHPDLRYRKATGPRSVSVVPPSQRPSTMFYLHYGITVDGNGSSSTAESTSAFERGPFSRRTYGERVK